MTATRPLVPLLVFVTAACTASWNSIVKYSSEPELPGVSTEVTVYRTVLGGLRTAWNADSMVRDTTSSTRELEPGAGTLAELVPGHWVDSLKRQARAALSDPQMHQTAPDSLVALALHSLSSWQPTGRRLTLEYSLSRPGFNADSTMAAISVGVWCGPVCGAGQILLLARRPGTQWRVFGLFGLWRS